MRSLVHLLPVLCLLVLAGCNRASLEQSIASSAPLPLRCTDTNPNPTGLTQVRQSPCEDWENEAAVS